VPFSNASRAVIVIENLLGHASSYIDVYPALLRTGKQRPRVIFISRIDLVLRPTWYFVRLLLPFEVRKTRGPIAPGLVSRTNLKLLLQDRKFYSLRYSLQTKISFCFTG
jgi:hypothetical protein